MNWRADRVVRIKTYKGVKNACDAVLAAMAIAGAPAVILLATDPLIRYVPFISPNALLFSLVMAAILVPMVPVISFVAGFKPSAGGFWASVCRIGCIVVIATIVVFINSATLDWYENKKSAENLAASNARVIAQREAEEDKAELRRIVEEAVASACASRSSTSAESSAKGRPPGQ